MRSKELCLYNLISNIVEEYPSIYSFQLDKAKIEY